MEALIVVDMQNDFVYNKNFIENIDISKIIENINKLLPYFPIIIFTMDSHPKDHCSFKTNGGIWPEHCIENTDGEKIIKDIDMNKIKGKSFFVKKGTNKDKECYSAFKELHNNSSEILKILKKNKVEEVYICGIAGEYCVKETCIDASSLDFLVDLVEDAVGYLDQDKKNETLIELKFNKVWVIDTEKIIDFLE